MRPCCLVNSFLCTSLPSCSVRSASTTYKKVHGRTTVAAQQASEVHSKRLIKLGTTDRCEYCLCLRALIHFYPQT